jgi:Prokaryotic E2 family E
VTKLETVTKLTPKALADFEVLKARHPSAKLTEFGSGAALVTLDLNLPEGWSPSKVVLHFLMPNGYPVAAPDGFWVVPTLQVAGKQPRSTEINGTIPEANIPAQRFSWHFDDGHWSPNKDNLLTWLRSCQERLEKVE